MSLASRARKAAHIVWRSRGILAAALACCVMWLASRAVLATGVSTQAPAWNPVEGPPAGAKYVGDGVCATCHPSEGKTYKTTPMGQAAEPPSEAEILRAHPRLEFRQGAYRYVITRSGSRSTYSVSDGRQTISAPIIWAFGQGEAGQTYLFRWQGAYYQSRVSFFNDVERLDLTLDAPRSQPPTLQQALGGRMNEEGARLCIACHTTRAVIGGEFHPQAALPGVRCEACHGPGADHVAAIQAGRVQQDAIFNPGKLEPYALDDFCGSCHRTWSKVVEMGVVDVRNVRFQPYRLQNSRCWSADDARISCLACHNPHRPLVRDAGFYDSKCLACHLAKGAAPNPRRPGAACPVSHRDCVTCHMPKYALPGGHYKFTDHDIRVVRAGEPYPG